MTRERLAEQTQARAERDALQRQYDDVNGWLDFGRRSGLHDPSLPDRSAELSQLPELERQYDVARQTAELLKTPEREARLTQLRELDEKKSQLDGQVALLRNASGKFLALKLQLTQQAEAARSALESADDSMRMARVRLSVGIETAAVDEFLNAVLAEKGPWRSRIEAAQQRAAQLSVTASERRNERNGIRRALADARDDKGSRRHPQWLDHDSEEISNTAWDSRLNLLEGHELEKHHALAAEKKQEWEDRLKEQVLDKLNERLKDAEVTVRQLRQYLDRDVGRYRYRVSQKRDPAMSTVWHLLDAGFEPTDELMRGVKDEEMERA
jgi:hypothetical protein